MKLPYIDSNITVTGPYLNKAQGRRFVTLTNQTTKKLTQKTYAKYLMEMHLGRELSKEETVDHIDRNKLNDVLDNFQILSQSEHTSIDNIKIKLIKVCCAWCHTEFEKSPKHMRMQHRQGCAGPFCSAVCRGKYGAHIRNGGKEFKIQEFVKSEYYFSDKSDKK